MSITIPHFLPLSTPSNRTHRSHFLDSYRGLAVVLMIAFHFCWDLREFGYLSYQLHSPFWVSFRAVIMTLFLSAVGWSAYLSYHKGFSIKPFVSRNGKLLICAACISLATYLVLPSKWIFFGILHFIFLASIVVTPCVRWPKLCLVLGLASLTLYFTTDWLNTQPLRHTLTELLHLPRYTVDIVYPFPWLSVVFIGPILGYWQVHKIALPNSKIVEILAWFGRHALSIYLVHQVILFGLVASVHWLLKNF